MSHCASVSGDIGTQLGVGVAPRRRLRVCHVAYTFYENDSRVTRYAEATAERGDQVDVIALRRNGQSRRGRSGGVNIFRIQCRAITEKSALAYLLKLLWFTIKSTLHVAVLHSRRTYDVIHVHNLPDFLVFSAVVPKLMGARVILDIHDILPELYAGKFGSQQQSRVFRWLLLTERLSCRFADHVIVANHLWHRKLVRRAVAAEKCTAIMNYPDLRLFKPCRVGDTGEHGRRKFVMLYPGTLNQHQGLDVAVKAFALVKDRMPDAEFHIYGEGPARPALAGLIQALALDACVKLFDRVPLTDVAAIMARADIGVVPKRADGFGNEAFSTKTLEFMACGVPVVLSRTDIDTYYFDESIVRFFASGQEADLAGVLLDVYRHRGEDGERVAKAREFARQYSWQERVKDYLLIVDGLAARSRGHLLVRSAS